MAMEGKGISLATSQFPATALGWTGAGGQTILPHAEQGLGDTIQFIRYLPMVRELAGKIVIECQGELRRLFEEMAGDCAIVPRGQPLPAFDTHCPLVTLARVFATTLETIPRRVPYLQANVDLRLVASH